MGAPRDGGRLRPPPPDRQTPAGATRAPPSTVSPTAYPTHTPAHTPSPRRPPSRRSACSGCDPWGVKSRRLA
eukprot:scaffold8168_cov93-Isochrysis_galbana.AAC.4